MVLLDEADVEETRQALAEKGGKVMVTSLDADMAEQLAAGASAASMENDE